MDVIRFVLTEDDVRAIGQEVLCSIAVCTTSSVMMEVRRYLLNPRAAADVKGMVEFAFADELEEITSENDTELRNAIRIINGLMYFDICSTMSLQELESLRGQFAVLQKKGKFRPYKSPIRLYSIKEVVNDLKEKGHSDIAKKIYNKRNVFSETPTARAVGTPWKRTYFSSTEREIKKRGIDFLIRMKKNNVSAMAWRFL